jgi:CBS domain-containing protein
MNKSGLPAAADSAPAVKDGVELVGIISIGDVLKHRLGEVQLEANVLRDYAMAARR